MHAPAPLAATPAFYQRRKKRSPELLGQILLRHGAVDAGLLRRALRLQEERGGQLGRILVASGGCSEAALAHALLEQVQLRAARGHVDASLAARETPALAGLHVEARPLATVAALVATDVAALLVGCAVGWTAELLRTDTVGVAGLPLLAGAILVSLAVFAVLGQYAPAAPSPPDAIRNASASVTLAFVCVGAVTLLHGGRHAWSLPLVVVSWASALLLVPLARGMVRRACAKRAWWGHPVVVLGAGKAARRVVRALRANPACGLKPVVMLDDDPAKHGTLRASLRDDAVEVRSVKQPAAELVTPSLRAMSRDLVSESTRNLAAAAIADGALLGDEGSAVHAIPPPGQARARGMFAEVEGIPVVGDLALAPVLAERLRISYAIVAMPGVASDKLLAAHRACRRCLLAPPRHPGPLRLRRAWASRRATSAASSASRSGSSCSSPGRASRSARWTSRSPSLGGVFVLPIVAALALLIRLDSRGPALYPQDRLGRDGRRFRALKFRTMHGDGEERLRAVLDADPRCAAEYAEFHKLSDDPRVTRVGRILRKYSLDELPQLWNVLTGDMSLVGPRPYLEREIPQMNRREQIILRAPAGDDWPLAGGRPQRDGLRDARPDRRALRPQLVAVARRVRARAHDRRRRAGDGLVVARLSPGMLVAGSYVAERWIGQGASGEVWAASHTFTRERVALKVLAAEAAGDDETVERFRREAMFLARAAGEHVARIVDFVHDPTAGMVLVMELVEGEPLGRVLERRTLSVEEAIGLGVDLLAGVEALHAARVIHRDLKPGNVLMRERPDGTTTPVLCDFGLSRLSRGRDASADPSLTELTKGDVAMGTLTYMAPEQVLNAKQATEQSDLYAVAAILHRAVSGSHPFAEEASARQVARAKVMRESPPFDTGRSDPIARGFERVVTRGLRRRPAERYADAAEMRLDLLRLAELARAAEHEEVTQRAPTHVPPEIAPSLRARTPARRSRVATAVGVALVFAAGVATGKLWPSREPASPPVVVAISAPAPQPTPAPPPLEPAATTTAEVGESHIPSPPPTAPPPTPSASIAAPPPRIPAAVAQAVAPPSAAPGDDDNPY